MTSGERSISIFGGRLQILLRTQSLRSDYLDQKGKVWILFREWQHLLAIYRLWCVRQRTRKQLAQMSDYMLQDIGVSRYAANLESGKRFWQP